MAQIPDPTGISRRIPSGQRSIARADGSGIGRAMQGLGQTVTSIGQQVGDAQDRYDLARAKTLWLQSRAEVQEEIDGDQGFEDMEDRYRAKVGEKLDDVAGVIRNGALRQQFAQSQLQDLETGAARVRAKARGLEVEHHKGLLIEDLNQLRQTGLKTQSSEAIAIMQERIDAAADMGYLGADEAAMMRQKSAVDYAVARIEMAPASEREELLKGPLGKIVPADTAATLTEKAKQERIRNEAMLTTDLWLAQDLDLSEGMKQAEQIKDPDVRRATEERFKLQYQVKQKALQDESNNLYEGLIDQLEAGDWSYDDLTDEERATLTGAQQNNLKKLYADKVTGNVTQTDIGVYDHLNVLLSAGEYKEARQYYLDNVASLSPADQKSYSKLTSDALGDSVEVKSFMTQKEYLKTAAATSGVGKKETQLLNQRLDDWYQAYQVANDKVPNDVEVQSAVDRLLLKRPDTGFFSDDYFFESPEAATELLLETEPQELVQKVANAFEARFNRKPTPQELSMHYFNNKRKGNLNGN